MAKKSFSAQRREMEQQQAAARQQRSEAVRETTRDVLSVTQAGDALKAVPVARIKRGSYQPRLKFDLDEIKKLAGLIIESRGVVEPIIVRPIADDPLYDYELVAGERRLIAVREYTDFNEIKAVVRDCSDAEALVFTSVENFGRVDLSDYEKSRLLQPLVELGVAKTNEGLGRIFGVSGRVIQYLSDFEKLPPSVIEKLEIEPSAISYTYLPAVLELIERGDIELLLRGLDLVISKHLKPGKSLLDWIAARKPGRKQVVERYVRNAEGKQIGVFEIARGKVQDTVQLKLKRRSGVFDDVEKTIISVLQDLGLKVD